MLGLSGLDLARTEYWSWDGNRQALAGTIFTNDSSLMDIGLLLGATIAAAFHGRVRIQMPIGFRGAAGAALGGVLMGIGARLSSGCNIGAFVGGVSSSSLHGFIWLFAALPGTWLGIRLRPFFGLPI